MVRIYFTAVIIAAMLFIGCGKKETSSKRTRKRAEVELDAESKAQVKEAVDKFRQAMKEGNIEEDSEKDIFLGLLHLHVDPVGQGH